MQRMGVPSSACEEWKGRSSVGHDLDFRQITRFVKSDIHQNQLGMRLRCDDYMTHFVGIPMCKTKNRVPASNLRPCHMFSKSFPIGSRRNCSFESPSKSSHGLPHHDSFSICFLTGAYHSWICERNEYWKWDSSWPDMKKYNSLQTLLVYMLL